MTQTIRERMAAEGLGFVGREPELAVLRLVLADDGPSVVFVHGIGGTGKSTLLRAFSGEVRDRGAVVLAVDGGEIEPTVRGFLEALSAATGIPVSTAEDAARALRLGRRVVLTLDRYESLRPLDRWLRRSFVPALGDDVRVVAAGREPPEAAWFLEMGRLVRDLRLGNLPDDDAERVLRTHGVAEADVVRINRLAHGHPLSLRLAAAALTAGEERDPDAATMSAIVGELTRLYLDRLDPPTREALDAASVVRRPTLPLLGAMLPDASPQDAFDRLRRQPFVELGTDGLVVHDTIREAVSAYLRATDPERSRRYRIAAWRFLRDEVARAAPADIRRVGADLLYMVESPKIRDIWFATSTQHCVVEPARPDDWADIVRIAERVDPGAPIGLVEPWWHRMPEAFRIARDDAGAAAGFCAISELARIPRALFEVDPIARSWRDHHRAEPVPSGQRVAVHRFQRGDPHHRAHGEVLAALEMEVPRSWMEMRPGPGRHYGVSRYWGGDVAELDARFGNELLPGMPRLVEGILRYAYLIEFGPASVDGWLTRLIASELRIEDDSLLDTDEHQLVLDGRRVDLTVLEYALFRYLCERPGRVVERRELLREVWGYASVEGSNVIDVHVRSLRRKLGDRAAVIETVRGVGYRYVPPAGRHADAASPSPSAPRHREPRIVQSRPGSVRLGPAAPLT